MAAVDEGTRITLRCEAHGGRPIPNVSWQRNGKMLKGELLWSIKPEIALEFYNHLTH